MCIRDSSRDILTAGEDTYLYSFCKFPIEVLENELFVGDVFHANNRRQLKDLKIINIFDVSGNCKVEFPEVNYHGVEIDQERDSLNEIDTLCAQIKAEVDAGNKPVLLYCKDGMKAVGIAIAYLMFSRKMDVNRASLIIFSRVSNVEINKKLYTQILIYTPGCAAQFKKL
eukprot:TRINITY_DN13842_c0_g1_i2.p1 TRINITY_DN13842_c0_g1~~TRINITY_DN13842_c0_g1_i2.p1  ORF type:complete len:189 (+),score=51.37 TRINITY_DN13842_c0_g1_i2:60-569(+)